MNAKYSVNKKASCCRGLEFAYLRVGGGTVDWWVKWLLIGLKSQKNKS